MSHIQYHLSGNIDSARKAFFSVRQNSVPFGLGGQAQPPNPAELLLGAFAACCLKNVDRFSEILGFDYASADIEVMGERQEKPTKIVAIRYVIHLSGTDEKLNAELLHRNIRKFGTIYNTLKEVCEVSGELVVDA